jgi:predicted DCC family thiol-disulfide oxidoreductase YuxK
LRKHESDAVSSPIIVFDAMCVLCSANARFVLKHDRAQRFLLASMQGDVGSGIYRKFGIDPSNPDSLILVRGETALRDSDAVLAIYDGLGWPWRILAVLRVVPRMLRDPVYRWIASNRYRFFGKRDSCWMPSPEDRRRVI